MKKLVITALSLAIILSLAACGKASGSVVTVAKDRDGLASGDVLSPEDAAALTAEIASAEKANGWMDGTVSDSIASCYLAIEADGEVTTYTYSSDGTLDDQTHMRSLKLGDAQCEAMDAILSNYVELSIKILRIPDLAIPDIQLKP